MASALSSSHIHLSPCSPFFENSRCALQTLFFCWAQEKQLIFTPFSFVFFSLQWQHDNPKALCMLEWNPKLSSCLVVNTISDSHHFQALVKLVNSYHEYLHHEYSMSYMCTYQQPLITSGKIYKQTYFFNLLGYIG